MVFTNPVDPTMNLAYNRPPSVTYEFLSGDAAVLHQIYGRDYQAAFQPTEERGVRFAVPLIVNYVAVPINAGVSAFDALRALSTSSAPYVCVLDHENNRFFALLQVVTGEVNQPGNLFVGSIIVTEITGIPAVVSISA